MGTSWWLPYLTNPADALAFDHEDGNWWEAWDDPEQVTRKRKAQEVEQQHGEAHTIWWLQLQDLSMQACRETHMHDDVSFNSLMVLSWHVLVTSVPTRCMCFLQGLQEEVRVLQRDLLTAQVLPKDERQRRLR